MRANFFHTRIFRPGFVAASLACSSGSLAAAAEGGNTIPAVVEPADVMNMGASLLLILLAIVAVGWLFRRMQGMNSHGGEVIKILATQPLGPKERILLVEVAGKQLVIGMTPSRIQTLYVPETSIEGGFQAPATASFADRLRTAVKGVTR